MAKIYAVKKGRKIGIYYTWDECKAQVDKYPSAEYKSFKTIEEAKAYLENGKNVQLQNTTLKQDEAIAYVDGSFDKETFAYAYGVVLFVGNEQQEFNKKFKKNEYSSMRNVAGEIAASMFVIEHCANLGIKKLLICYDYEGIEKWCTGAWKTNKEGTIAYKNFFDEYKDKMEITFKHVKGHSGDKWNDLADKLAKNALGL